MPDPNRNSPGNFTKPNQSAARRSSGRPSRECRARVRYPYHAEISFQPLEHRKEGTWRPATARDISTKGLGVILDALVSAGAILAIKLEGPCQRLTRPLLVRVVRSEKQSAGNWELGCTFAISLGEHELQALVPAEDSCETPAENESSSQSPKKANQWTGTDSQDPFLRGSPAERRAYPRRRITVAVLLSYAYSAAELAMDKQALAIDASGGGMKLLVPDFLGRGIILRLRSAKAPPNASVEVRVKSCSPKGAKWCIGVEFLKPPPSEFMLFFQ